MYKKRVQILAPLTYLGHIVASYPHEVDRTPNGQTELGKSLPKFVAF